LLELSEVWRRIVRVESCTLIVTIVIVLPIIVSVREMLGLLVGLTRHRIECVTIEIHLNILWIQAL